MSALTPASEVMLRHSDEFIERRVLFAGDLQDSLPARGRARPHSAIPSLAVTEPDDGR